MRIGLRVARVNRGLTQEELAEKVDVTKKDGMFMGKWKNIPESHQNSGHLRGSWCPV